MDTEIRGITTRFVIETAAALARIEESQRGTNNHLSLINGRVGKNDARISVLETELTGRIAAKVENARWAKYLHPVLLILGLIFLGIMLLNGPQLMKFLVSMKELIK